MNALKEKYANQVVPEFTASGKYPNVHQVPRITKVVINMGMNANLDKDGMQQAIDELSRITGQRPVTTKARRSVSNFKLREGMNIGAKVTLRGARMYEFLDRLLNVALPRIRDFRGVSATAFDGRGNYTLGIREETIFPEVDPNAVKRTQGMDISIVTTAETDAEARQMLKGLGMPFATE
jgi:large subunit ribosomal protein L5